MDLSALWTREKARVAAELNLVNVKPVNAERRASVSVAKDESESGGTPNGVNRAKVSIVVAASPTVKPSAGTKKKSTAQSNSTTTTYLRDRDRLFRLLLETSIAPSPVKVIPHFSGNNEFAMEYADRAVRQFVPQPAPPQSTLESPAQTTNSASVARITTNRSPSIRVNSIVQTSSAPVQVAQSAVQTAVAFPAMTKTAQIIRKNGRKRAGTEYSSQTLKPYVGDMFSTRGDYIDGMLYMSRMKRSYQAMVSSSDPRGKKLDFSFSNPQWGELARTEGRNVLKDGVSDAFAVAGGSGKPGPSRRSASTIVLSSPSEEGGEQGATLTSVQRKQQQRCSLTLSNWSFNPENARLMVEENVVEALIRLCKDGDKTTRLNCVTTFMNLSHLCELRRVIVQQSAVKTVAEIVNDMEDKTIRTACAITFVSGV